MKNPDRIPYILNTIRQVWEQDPDLRLGQLIANIIKEDSIYYIEDGDLIILLIQAYEQST